MKSLKLCDGVWRIDATNGSHCYLTECPDGWHVEFYKSTHSQSCDDGRVYKNRFAAKVAAEQMLGG